MKSMCPLLWRNLRLRERPVSQLRSTCSTGGSQGSDLAVLAWGTAFPECTAEGSGSGSPFCMHPEKNRLREPHWSLTRTPVDNLKWPGAGSIKDHQL